VLFDAVGTLIRPDPPVADVYLRAGRRHGSTVSAGSIAARFRAAIQRHCVAGPASDERERQRWQAIVADVFPDVDVSTGLFPELWEHFAAPAHWAVYEDVAETLVELGRRGLRVGVASNFDERLLQVCRGQCALRDVAPIYYSAQVGYSKPHPQFYSEISLRLGLAPSEILLVGDDRTNDVAGAIAAGWHALRINRDADRGGRRELSDLRQLLEPPS